MSDTTSLVMGERGRLVIPAHVRARHGLKAGSRLILVDEDESLVLMTRDELQTQVWADMAGSGLAEQLIADRRREADQDLIDVAP